MKTLPIVLWLQSLSPEQRSRVLNDHAMLGYMEYHYPSLLSVQEREAKSFKQQQLKNIIHEEEALKLKEILDQHSLKVLFLKGITLIHDLYPEVGTRFMSDIDCYVSRVDFDRLDDILIPLGYKPHHSSVWLGNRHKREYTFQTQLGAICIEFHNKLFWHRSDPTIDTRLANLPTLGPEETFVYLCGHYAFLHTCQKLYWLWDIYLFLVKYESVLEDKKVDELLTYFGFQRSWSFIKQLLIRGFHYESRIKSHKNYLLVTKHSFFDDRAYRLGHQLIKFLIKDKLSDTLRYIFAYKRK